MSSHTLAPTTICDLSHSLCWRPLTDLGQISSVTYFCHPLWFVCGHRKGILMSPLKSNTYTETLGEADHSVLGGCVGSHEGRRGDACHEKGNTQCKARGPFFFLIVCFTRYSALRIKWPPWATHFWPLYPIGHYIRPEYDRINVFCPRKSGHYIRMATINMATISGVHCTWCSA